MKHFGQTGYRGMASLLALTALVVALAFSAAAAQTAGASLDGSQNDLLRWWPVLIVAAGTVAFVVRAEALAKASAADLQKAREEFNDKLTFYATTAELAEVRSNTLVALSQVTDLKPALARVESKLDTVLLARLRSQDDRRD